MNIEVKANNNVTYFLDQMMSTTSAIENSKKNLHIKTFMIPLKVLCLEKQEHKLKNPQVLEDRGLAADRLKATNILYCV